MNRIITFVKQWTLLCSLIVGTVIYLLFSRISFLMPIGDFMGPKLTEVMPAVIFCILYVTFCKIQIHDLKPRTWHFIAALMVEVLAFTHNPELRLIFEGMFVCFICPTAAAAAVVTDKLGGSIASMTVYLLIANAFTAIIIPTFFPLVERGSGLTFTMAFLMVLQRVLTVLVAPLLLAFLTRKFLPKLAGLTSPSLWDSPSKASHRHLFPDTHYFYSVQSLYSSVFCSSLSVKPSVPIGETASQPDRHSDKRIQS